MNIHDFFDFFLKVYSQTMDDAIALGQGTKRTIVKRAFKLSTLFLFLLFL
jgi:hypothetical protein